jgi:hypothetical protein
LLFEYNICLGAGKLALGLAQGSLIDGGVNFRHQLAFFYRRVEINVKGDYLPRHLAAHIHTNDSA